MPNPTPGAQQLSLVDRVAAVFGYQRRAPDLSQAQFGPGTPIEPAPIAPGQTPRQFEYNSGVNLSSRRAGIPEAGAHAVPVAAQPGAVLRRGQHLH
jgi:hypothetical protein